MAQIAVDAMGGDHAPGEVVVGAVEASRRGASVVLVGDERVIRPLLEEADADLEIVHAADVIAMHEEPARALREKKDSSISTAARLVASGRAAGLVSAGSTGATMAAAALIIGRLPEVNRPSLATLMPGRKVVLDSGANVACRAVHLGQFAVMGAALAASHYGVTAPRVGLLNIGEEPGKGRDLDKEAYELLASLPGITFVGNVEGRDLATDAADVFVTDGFTGNVFLKTAEGAARMVQRMVLSALMRPGLEAVAAQLGPVVADMQQQLDPEGTGGAHLLGVEGVVVVAHGSSSRKAVANAIAMAQEGADDRLPEKIARGLAAAAANLGDGS